MGNTTASKDSPFYPYEKIQDYSGYAGIEAIPRKIITYLCDLPLAGYTPPDNNAFPRCRFMKYLVHDGGNPLAEKLPTPQEKTALIFKPDCITGKSGKGYRLFPLSYNPQAQTEAATSVRCYMGRTVATDVYTSQLSVVFEILTSYAYDTNLVTEVYSRSYAIEQAILESLCGVNMAGVGTFYFDRRQHPDCGSYPIDDGTGTNVGRRLTIGLSYTDSEVGIWTT